MAYKFQMGDARLSGSVRQEGSVTADSSIAGSTLSASSDVYGLQVRTAGTVRIASDGALSNIAAITQTAGDVTLGGASDTAIDLAADSLYFRDSDGTMKRDTVADIAAGMAGVGIASQSGQFSVDLSELLGGAIASGDSFAFIDSDDSDTSKKETVDDLATLFAGDGLSASSAVLAVNVDDSSIETNADTLRVKALGVTNAMLAGSIADSKLNQITTADKVAGSAVELAATSAMEDSTGLRLKAATAGSGLSMTSQVLAVEVSGAVKIASDKVGISGSFAGNGLGYAGGVDSISSLAVNVDDSSIEISSDSLQVKALGVTNAMLAGSIADSKLNQITTADKVAGSAVELAATSAFEDSTGLRLKAATAGEGLSMSSQVLALDLNELTAEAIASGDFLAFVDSTDNGTHKESVDDLATLFAGNGLSATSAVMAVDLNELSAATVDVSADSIAIIDANDSNGSRKESIADLVAAMAGAGLSAASGQLSVQGNSVTSFGDENATAAEGFNYGTATLTADRTITLPASPSVGDVIHIKAPPSLGGYNLLINKAGSQTIDGHLSVRIESDSGAVSLVLAAADTWKLF
jgi:hypothetical protein